MRGGVIIAALLVSGSAAPAMAACDDLMPAANEAAQGPLVPLDLARLRDIGQATDRIDLASPLSVSPDGRQVAFVLRRADVSTNSYCQGLVVADLADGRTARLVDKGGDLIRESYPLFGHALPESGVARVITPLWSPDGRRIAWLKRTGSAAQIWLVDVARGAGTEATGLAAGVEDFRWASDGRHIILASRTGIIPGKAALEKEALGGYLVDNRFRPLSARYPFLRNDSIETRYFALEPATGEMRPASAKEGALLNADRGAAPTGPLKSSRSPGGALAWTRADPADMLKRSLFVSKAGAQIECSACRGEIADLWWGKDGLLYYLTREGEARSQTGLYRWRATSDSLPERLYLGEDLLLGCQTTAQADMICLQEDSLVPRRLVSFDAESGEIQPFWDPNPGIGKRANVTVERLGWTNSFGIATFGDLVLPVRRKPGERLPLVIVQYGSRGFLRGGTGDEYPILALAARGYAVLSFQRPLHWSLEAARRGAGAVSDSEDQADRKSVQSSLETGIALVLRRGIFDPAKIGITGLSDGATTVHWMLTQTRLFAAAAMSSCCLDPGLLPLLGEAQIAALTADGFPPPGEEGDNFWAQSSLSRNADKVEAPILMQLSDDEFLGALESYWALKTRGRPVEMRVFPGERHIKFQPAHRLAIYERSIQWFDFWLRDVEDPSPLLAPQYARWRSMRDETMLQLKRGERG